ncbi:MAG: tetratricopeptide repeat protein, partial [Candidatus Hydrogenedentes bacterium]|nr:tetratricopeptide repeat protein [Candidatus Hydrogenedentota bacterium]
MIRIFAAAVMCVCGLLLGLTAGAESFREQVEYGNALLNSDDFEGAREVYRNLQIEHPENEVLYYSLGCTDYEEGESVTALQDPEGAIEFFASARDAFKHAMTAPEKWLRTDASYNHANSLAQIAKQQVFLGDQEATITAFEEAVQAYEEVLDRYPEHQEARHNLEHMRYLLKRMLQIPPQNNEQSEGEQGQQGQDQQDQQQQD